MLEKIRGFIKNKKIAKVKNKKENFQNIEAAPVQQARYIKTRRIEDKDDRILSTDEQKSYYKALKFFKLSSKVENYKVTYEAIEQMKKIMIFFGKYYHVDSTGKADNLVLKKIYDIIRNNSEIVEIEMPQIMGTIQRDKTLYHINSIVLNREIRRAISQTYENYKDEIEEMLKHKNELYYDDNLTL